MTRALSAERAQVGRSYALWALQPFDRVVGAEAIEVARAAAPQSADRAVLVAEAKPARDLNDSGLASGVAADRWIWYIYLSDGGTLSGEGSMVVIDYLDGRVIRGGHHRLGQQ